VSILFFLAGVAIVLSIAFDLFQTVIVPRPTGRRYRPSTHLVRSAWYVWGATSDRIGDEQREDFLGAFAPFMLVTLLITWIAALIFGYALMLFALREQIKPAPDFAGALYFAGTSLLTIGFGDLVPKGTAVRFLCIAAGASGLGAFAIITAFLFSIFGAYHQREAFVVMFTNRAGAPPSGVDLIETHAQLDIVDSLVHTMRESQLWLAQVLETHLAYPILTYFRSTHDDISWIAVVGTILDASTLVLTTLDVPTKGEATIVNRLGRHFVNDFARYYRLPEANHVGIERDEFDRAYQKLHEAGIPLLARDSAWQNFATIRSTYASRLNFLARYWRIPLAQWVGDRSLLSHHPPLDVASAAVETVETVEAR
jgi:hypothetical protein